MKQIILFFVTVFFATNPLSAQNPDTQQYFGLTANQFRIGLGYGMPLGDLADRYGAFQSFNIGMERMTGNNWIFGAEMDFHFGTNVKEDVLDFLRLDNEEVLGADNAYADVFLRSRGINLGVHFGKVVPLNSKTRSGWRITFGAGLMQNNIRIVDESTSLPQLYNDYEKGYDRLTRGFYTQQFFGYHNIDKKRRKNYMIGIEFTQGFTKEIRAINFDTGLPTSNSFRFDGLLKLKAAWFIPFYGNYVEEEIFY